MLLHSSNPFLHVVKAARLASTALLLLLITGTEISASTLEPTGREILLTPSTLASFPAPREDAFCAAAPAVSLTRSHTGTAWLPPPETATGGAPSQTTTAGTRIPDWHGIWRDTGVLFGSQIVVTGIIFLLPESFSGWSEEQKESSFSKWAKNVRHPHGDSDAFYINYILHPYWGATYYTRARERGMNRGASFMFSALMSAMYEFGVESFFEKPSTQDLIITPVAGSLLGAFVFEPWRESVRRKEELRWYDDAVLIFTDPIGVLSRGIEKMFGIKSTVSFNYSTPQLQKLTSISATESKTSRIEILLQFPLD